MISSDRICGPTPFRKALNLIFPKLSLQNMRGFDHSMILSPSFHELPKEHLATAQGGGGFSEKRGGGVQHASWNPYPISDQNLWFSLPYFWPDKKFDTSFHTWSPGAGVWPEHVPSCYGMYTVGVNIKMEMVLSPNDEEIASSKKHTQFRTRVPKPYSISAQNGQNWYPISDQNG